MSSTFVVAMSFRVVKLLLVMLAFGAFGRDAAFAQKKPAADRKPPIKKEIQYPPVHLLGMRPGLTKDSIEKVLTAAGTAWREVTLDTITRSYSDKTVKVYLLDSIYCRFTYMRMVFVFDEQTQRLRRISITPRQSSIIEGRSDDVAEILLLYFGQTWGRPEVQLDLTPAQFKWHRGNLDVRGFIRRGYPLWVIEG